MIEVVPPIGFVFPLRRADAMAAKESRLRAKINWMDKPVQPTPGLRARPSQRAGKKRRRHRVSQAMLY